MDSNETSQATPPKPATEQPRKSGRPKTRPGYRLDKLPQGVGLTEAVVICGSKSELASRLGVPRGNVTEWFRNGSVPSAWAIKINRLTGVDLVWLLQKFKPYRPRKEDDDEGGSEPNPPAADKKKRGTA